MPRPKYKSQYRIKKDRMIYLIKHPTTKEFYIGHTLSHNARSTYKDHYTEAKYKTAQMIYELKSTGQKPCFFELETLNCTAVQAYRHVIVWTKYFLEEGYINLDTGAVVEYADDLLPENISLYKEKKKNNIKEITACENCLFADYGRKMCPLKGADK